MGDLPLGRADGLPGLRQQRPGEVHAVHRRRPADPGHVHVTLEELVRRRAQAEPHVGRARPAIALHAGRGRRHALPGIAYQEYGKPALWRTVADAQRIDDPMRLRPGPGVLLPSLDALEATSSDAPRGEPIVPHGEEFSNTLLVEVDGQRPPGRRDTAARQRVRRRQQQRAGPVRAPVPRRRQCSADQGRLQDRSCRCSCPVQSTEPGGPEPLLEGEVTALEVEICPRRDAHRGAGPGQVAPALPRRRVEAYLNMTASDIVSKVAQRAGVAGRLRCDGGTAADTSARTASVTGTSCADSPTRSARMLSVVGRARWTSQAPTGRRRARAASGGSRADPLVLERRR